MKQRIFDFLFLINCNFSTEEKDVCIYMFVNLQRGDFGERLEEKPSFFWLAMMATYDMIVRTDCSPCYRLRKFWLLCIQ